MLVHVHFITMNIYIEENLLKSTNHFTRKQLFAKALYPYYDWFKSLFRKAVIFEF